MKRFLAILLIAAAACTVTMVKRPTPFEGRDILTPKTWYEDNPPTLYDAISRHRRHWISGSRAVVTVFIGNVTADLSTLSTISPRGVLRVKYLSESETTMNHGISHKGPSLEVWLTAQQ